MKQITLTKGMVALVDDVDYEWVNVWKWRVGHLGLYAERTTERAMAKRTTIMMHRFILKAPDGMMVDHINGNGLDNRRENLRLCTNSENLRNRGAQANNTSGFKGVYWDAKTKRWIAKINVDCQKTFLGRFPTAEAAAKAYDAKAIELHGEFAWTNF